MTTTYGDETTLEVDLSSDFLDDVAAAAAVAAASATTSAAVVSRWQPPPTDHDDDTTARPELGRGNASVTVGPREGRFHNFRTIPLKMATENIVISY